ncbi:hypothetical protein KC320_g7685 [Hortaea werneckii]|nr:hypothetical protein KC320_g7685 [Hortaea werneckii]
MHQAAHAALADSDHDDYFHRYDSNDLYEPRRHSAYSTDLTLGPSLSNCSQYMERPSPHSIANPQPHYPSTQPNRHSSNQWTDFRATSSQILHDIETRQRLEQCSRIRAKATPATLLPPRRIPVILRHMQTPFLPHAEKKVPHGGLPFHVFQTYESLFATLQMQAAALFPRLDIPSVPTEGGAVTARIFLVDGDEVREGCWAEWGVEVQELAAGVYDAVVFEFMAGRKRKEKKRRVAEERSLSEKKQIVTTRLRDGRNEGRSLSGFPSKDAFSSCRSLLGVLGHDASRATAKNDGTEVEKTDSECGKDETARPSSSASALKTAREPSHFRQRRRTVCGDGTKPMVKTQRPSRTASSEVSALLAEETPLLRGSDAPQLERRTGSREEESAGDLFRKEEKRTRYDDCRYGYPYFL